MIRNIITSIDDTVDLEDFYEQAELKGREDMRKEVLEYLESDYITYDDLIKFLEEKTNG